ncbi:unnamed protein product [Aphanomyces euteiches]|uniref:Uncharacterized protein n=2 Tax=Aphanomyces euteiches TaxID=100861 RepID=A0A6G0W7Z2_9STRA|nr:hypothetical protein Ae201684_018579 [Aphanomyces euteiches]KAH9079811.1 hypothetical protein Ae201684P_007487 [Aphanomyces euteiches]KAH9146656.1 hypothetical protein AeRB84_009482 [Aphanomyces euteiches]
MSRIVPAGLTLAFVHAFVERCGGRDAFDQLTTADVCSNFVLPTTATTKLSLVDHIAQDPTYGSAYVQPALWFVSHAWSYRFLDVVDALDYFFAENGLDDTTAFWFCLFNNNQHEIQDNERDSSYWFEIFYRSLTSIGNVVMVLSPWKNPETLTRMWCVFEVYASIVANCRFEVALGKTQKEDFLQEIVQEDNAFLRMLASIKSETSETKVDADRAFIQAKIEADVGFAKLDRMVFQVLEAWMVQTLETQINLKTTRPSMQAKYLEALGNIAIDNSDFYQAKGYFSSALGIWRLENAPETWRAQSELAFCLACMQTARDEWEALFQKALEHQERTLEPSHRDIALTLGLYGESILAYGDYTLAMELLTKALEIRQETSGVEDPLAAGCMTALGRCFMHQRAFLPATTLLERAYATSCRIYGQDHQRTLVSRSNLALVYGHQCRFEDCLRMFQASHASSVRTFGPEHVDSWRVLSSTGSVYCALGQYHQADAILTLCRDKFEALLGPDSIWHLKCTRDLGKLYYCMGDFDKAHSHTTAVLPRLFKVYSGQHSMLLNAIYDLYLLQVAMNALESLEALQSMEELLERVDCMDETWRAHPCRSCFERVCGCRYVCASCPIESRWFCGNCVAEHKVNCSHDEFKLFVPPARYLQEQRLRLLEKASTRDEYEQTLVKYQEYCTKYNVEYAVG